MLFEIIFSLTNLINKIMTRERAKELSLRDYLAAKALQGCCANRLIMESIIKAEKNLHAILAREAFLFADAMLKERKATGGKDE